MRDWFFWFVEAFFTPILAWLFRRDTRGMEHIPATGPVIIAANHVSHLDPIVLGKMVLQMRPKRYPRYLAKAELFEKQPLAWGMRMIHQIPVDRGTKSVGDSLRSAVAALEAGELIIVFPEGTISPLFIPMKPHSGVARLARDTGVPVVPVGLWGTHRTWTKYRPRDIVRKRPLTVTFGEPVSYGPTDSVRDVTHDIMRRVIECVEMSRARYPDTAEEGAWWGPPEWPTEAAGRWRPRLDKSMSPEEALSACRDALDAAVKKAGGSGGLAEGDDDEAPEV